MKKLLALPLLLLFAAVRAEELPLSGFAVTISGEAQAKLGDDGLAISMDRTDARVFLQPVAGAAAWDLSASDLLLIDLENTSSDQQLRINVRLVGGQELVTGAALNPGEKRTLRTRLPHRWPLTLPTGLKPPTQLDTHALSAIEFFMQWPFERSASGIVQCRVTSIRTAGEAETVADSAKASYLPFVDPYGQYVHGEWPEKVKSDDDLVRARATEKAVLERTARPSSWNEFGGWKDGPRLSATGSFRTEKVDGKWYFVDPSGNLFFSHGIDVVRAHSDAMKTRGREDWFVGSHNGADWQPVERNLQVKYGRTDYLAEFHADLEARLLGWGFNTIGDWASDAFLATARKTPYGLQLTDFNWKMPRIGKMKVYDVYDPVYIARMAGLLASEMSRTEVAKRSVDDPYCIGYFIDNELGFGRDGQIATELLACPPTQAAKIELLRVLRERHASIESLNAAWKSDYASWDALLANREAPKEQHHRVDTDAFTAAMMDRYFALCRESIKKTAPHRLYLGTRFVGTDSVRPWLYESCARHSDVLSVNIYAHSPANFPVDSYPDVPVLIGEFHFGVRQRGMLSPGLCLAGVDEEDRGLAYTRFLQGALAHPRIVGAHWFQFRDQPLLGRGDGEAYQIGFVDVADTPYPGLIKASRQVGESLYTYRMTGAPAQR